MLYILKHIDIYINAENEISVEMMIANQCKGERTHLFPFLMKELKPIKIVFIFSIFIYLLLQKKVYLLQIYIIIGMVSILKVWFCESVYIFTRNLLPKKLENRIFIKWIRLNDYYLSFIFLLIDNFANVNNARTSSCALQWFNCRGKRRISPKQIHRVNTCISIVHVEIFFWSWIM